MQNVKIRQLNHLLASNGLFCKEAIVSRRSLYWASGTNVLSHPLCCIFCATSMLSIWSYKWRGEFSTRNFSGCKIYLDMDKGLKHRWVICRLGPLQHDLYSIQRTPPTQSFLHTHTHTFTHYTRHPTSYAHTVRAYNWSDNPLTSIVYLRRTLPSLTPSLPFDLAAYPTVI